MLFVLIEGGGEVNNHSVWNVSKLEMGYTGMNHIYDAKKQKLLKHIKILLGLFENEK